MDIRELSEEEINKLTDREKLQIVLESLKELHIASDARVGWQDGSTPPEIYKETTSKL